MTDSTRPKQKPSISYCSKLFSILSHLLLLIISISILAYAIILKNLDEFEELNKEIKNLDNSQCKSVPIPLNNYGAEDIEIYDDQYLITAAGNFYLKMHTDLSYDDIKSGNIYLIPKDGVSEIITLTTLNFPEGVKFYPHGIYSNSVNNEIYVLNHAFNRGGERIDHFRIDISSKTATYIDTMNLPDMLYGITNDFVVLDDKDTVILSTCQIFKHDFNGPNKSKTILAMYLEVGLKLKLTYVYSCSYRKNECVLVPNTEGLLNNGVVWDKKDKVYVADTSDKSVKEYMIVNKHKGFKNLSLVLLRKFDVEYQVDNLAYDAENEKIYTAMFGRGNDINRLVEYIQTNHELPYNDENIKDLDKAIYRAGSGEIDIKTGDCKSILLSLLILL